MPGRHFEGDLRRYSGIRTEYLSFINLYCCITIRTLCTCLCLLLYTIAILNTLIVLSLLITQVLQNPLVLCMKCLCNMSHVLSCALTVLSACVSDPLEAFNVLPDINLSVSAFTRRFSLLEITEYLKTVQHGII